MLGKCWENVGFGNGEGAEPPTQGNSHLNPPGFRGIFVISSIFPFILIQSSPAGVSQDPTASSSSIPLLFQFQINPNGKMRKLGQELKTDTENYGILEWFEVGRNLKPLNSIPWAVTIPTIPSLIQPVLGHSNSQNPSLFLQNLFPGCLALLPFRHPLPSFSHPMESTLPPQLPSPGIPNPGDFVEIGS